MQVERRDVLEASGLGEIGHEGWYRPGMLSLSIEVPRLAEVLLQYDQVVVERTNTPGPDGSLIGWTEIGRIALVPGQDNYIFYDAAPPAPTTGNYYRTAYALAGGAAALPYSGIRQGIPTRPDRRVWGTSDTGYWGPNPRAIVRGWNLPDRIHTLNQQQLWAMGRPAFLYLPVHPNVEAYQPNLGGNLTLTPCSCRKKTSESADRTCVTCYGTSYAPGYVRMLSATYALSSSEYAVQEGFTPAALPVGLAVNTDLKPNRLVLADGALTGSITRTWQFSNPDLQPWETSLGAYTPPSPGTAAVNVEFSTDGGATWLGAPPDPAPSGVLGVRVTLSRAAAGDPSPIFEVFRLRHIRSEDQSPDLLAYRNEERPAGAILVLRPWNQQKTAQDAERGLLVQHPGMMSWTAPLSAFDQRVLPDTPQAALPQDDCPMPPFLQLAYGIREGQRYALNDIAYSEETLRLTKQRFNERRIQPGEVLSRVW